MNGEIVVDGPTFPDGTKVKVFVPEDGESFDFTPEQLNELDAAIAAIDRSAGDYDDQVQEKLRSMARKAN